MEEWRLIRAVCKYPNDPNAQRRLRDMYRQKEAIRSAEDGSHYPMLWKKHNENMEQYYKQCMEDENAERELRCKFQKFVENEKKWWCALFKCFFNKLEK